MPFKQYLQASMHPMKKTGLVCFRSIVLKLRVTMNEEPMDFFLNVANMLAVEFEEMHRTDLSDKLAALFGGLPEPAFKMVPLLLHVALDIFLMRAIPNQAAIKD